MTEIRKATTADVPAISELALQLWPEHTLGELAEEFTPMFQGQDSAVFLAFRDDQPIGFAQCQLRRDYVEGTESSPVGYLEGIFVADPFRKHGIARSLLASCENWAKHRGCTEFASDCELANLDSLRFHLSMGFEEANRIICFTKKLN